MLGDEHFGSLPAGVGCRKRMGRLDHGSSLARRSGHCVHDPTVTNRLANPQVSAFRIVSPTRSRRIVPAHRYLQRHARRFGTQRTARRETIRYAPNCAVTGPRWSHSGACRTSETAASQPSRASGRRGIDHQAALGDLDLAGCHQPACRATGRLHQRSPRLVARRSRDGSRSFGWADRGAAGAIREQLEDRRFERLVRRASFGASTPIGAVADVVPIALPLLAPFDGAATTRTRLRFGNARPRPLCHVYS